MDERTDLASKENLTYSILVLPPGGVVDVAVRYKAGGSPRLIDNLASAHSEALNCGLGTCDRYGSIRPTNEPTGRSTQRLVCAGPVRWTNCRKWSADDRTR